jgi:3-hydroxyacyl-CoA dehydrogenase
MRRPGHRGGRPETPGPGRGHGRGHPADVVGVHFVEAGNGKPGLAELVLPDVTAAATAARAAALAARIGLNAVTSRDRPGFLIEALAYTQYNDAVRMFQDGYASPADIDTAMMLGCGYPRGPLQMLDEAGAARRQRPGRDACRHR